MSKRTYRMYGFVPYNLSPIQQGIQFGHAVQEYNNQVIETLVEKMRGLILEPRDQKLLVEFENWSNRDKTFIILNGGTTNSRRFDGNYIGTLNQLVETVKENEINHATFFEPDLGDQLTAIVFLVDDRVFDRENWPDYSGAYYTDGKTPIESEYWEWKMKFADTEKEADQIVFLRGWLPKFRLA